MCCPYLFPLHLRAESKSYEASLHFDTYTTIFGRKEAHNYLLQDRREPDENSDFFFPVYHRWQDLCYVGTMQTTAAPKYGRLTSCGKCILTAPSSTLAKQEAVCLTRLKPCLFPCPKMSLTAYLVTEVSLR